jgi:hypothetical protein
LKPRFEFESNAFSNSSKFKYFPKQKFEAFKSK